MGGKTKGCSYEQMRNGGMMIKWKHGILKDGGWIDRVLQQKKRTSGA